MTAYYNEFAPDAADWLENLIAAGLIAPGYVDRRSIKEVQPDDLIGFTQHHFFAGIGGWSLAARLAGWPDARPIWSASCPCQPFSGAGKGLGTDDPRHLWPDLLRLWRAFRPAVGVGEQVAKTAGYGWFDGVRAGLAGEGYASRAVDIPALAIDAPHERNRLYWVAVADAEGGHGGTGLCEAGSQFNGHIAANGDGACGSCGGSGRVGPFFPGGMSTVCGNCESVVHAPVIGRREGRAEPVLFGGGATIASADVRGVTLGDAGNARSQGESDAGGQSGYSGRRPDAQRTDGGDGGHGDVANRHQPILQGQSPAGQLFVHEQDDGPYRRPNRSFWTDADWLLCHDGKARRVADARASLLAHGFRGRVAVPRPAELSPTAHPEEIHWVSRIAAWKGFGNAIVPPLAAEVIGALMDVLDGETA